MQLYVRFFVAAFVLTASACGSSSPMGSSSNPPPGTPVQSISMIDFAFSPPSPSIKAGTTVQWVNNGTTVHTATSDNAGVWNSQDVAPAHPDNSCPYPPCSGTTPPGTFSFTFTQPGTYPYHCTYHGALYNMTGTITVTP